MANVITDDADIFEAYAFGALSSRNLSFLRRQAERTSSIVGGAAQRFASRLREQVESYDSEKIQRGLRAVRDRLERRWDTDEIREVIDLSDLQQLRPKMVRFMAANPRVRRERRGERCNGWRDHYFDVEPGYDGERHSDYRRVMNGIGVFDENDDIIFTTYLDAYEEDGSEELTFTEQVAILRGWQMTNDYMDDNYSDPTDPSNGFL